MQNNHILIVEDEDVTRFNLRNLFKAEGYSVSEAIDGETMEQELKANPVSLVIMDINLPGKNGLLLARELTKNPDLGLIFLTGRDSDIDKILGLEIVLSADNCGLHRRDRKNWGLIVDPLN